MVCTRKWFATFLLSSTAATQRQQINNKNFQKEIAKTIYKPYILNYF